MGRLDGKVAVITGGASGIGEGTVRLFAEEGARVVIADIQDGKGETLADTLAGAAVYQHTDVSQEADVKRAIDRALSEFGSLDCMFNNAGFGGTSGPIEEIPVDEYDATMAVLLRGVFLGMKHAAAVMKRQGHGSIISTASVAGLVAGYGPHVYNAAKAAVIHLTKSVAAQLGEDADEAAVIEMIKPRLAEIAPIKRSGLPRDIANAALWLASDDSSFVTGHALVVDGGLITGRRWSDRAEALRARGPMAGQPSPDAESEAAR